MGVEAVELFEAKGIHTDHVFIEDPNRKWRNKKLFISKDNRLKISTIHKFKGWGSTECYHVNSRRLGWK